ncbi:hypothetical protein ACWXVL_00125 [Mycoplasma sp. 128]
MYGIVFYLDKEKLIKEYKGDYHQGYEEIRALMRKYGFHWLSNSFYFSKTLDVLAKIHKLVTRLRDVEWFKKSLISFNVFKMEDMSDYTELIKDDFTHKIPME